jgi:chitinase
VKPCVEPTSWLSRIAGLLLVVLLSANAHAQKRIVAYVPNWVDLNSFSETIDYAKLTHINIAFENPTNAAGDLSFNQKNAGLITKAQANGVKVLLSIGGGSASGNKTLLNRYFNLLNETNRAGFTTKLADYVSAHGFDGLDVDIEGPSINEDYGAFIAELAKALKPRGKLLTAALSKGYGGNQVPDSVFAHLDFVNIMAYDGAGYWNTNAPGQHSSMEFARDNVRYWLERGLPKTKAVLGVPFYGYGFGEAYRKRDYSYSALLSAYPGAENADQVGNTIWYNGIPTIKAKTRFVVDEGLGGVMIWSLDYDVKGGRSLLSAIHETLNSNPAGHDKRP